MKREYITYYSNVLGEDMHMLVYGEKGYPVIVFQAQDAKCNNYEDFGMIDTIADYIENGTLQVFSVDNLDEESWSAQGDPAARAERQEDYFRFVTDELVPYVHEINGSDRRPLTTGCSMGATHAAIAAFRRPDLFQGCIALSGVYDTHFFFGDYMDGTLYENSIPTFLPNMPEDHPYIAIYAKRQLVLCVGQGAWEDKGIADLRVIRDAARAKGIDVWCDFWGNDVYHDWPWWKKQIRYFLPIVLEDMDKTLAAEAEEEAAAAAAKKAARKPAAKKTTTRKPAAKKAAEEPKAAEAEAPAEEAPAKKAPARRTTRKTAAQKAAEAAAAAEAPAEEAPAKKAPARRTTRKTAAQKAAEAAAEAPKAEEAPAKKAPARRTTRKTAAQKAAEAAAAAETPAEEAPAEKKPATKRTTRRTTKKTAE